MPWMVCTCHRRFYVPPSRMNEAKCDECAKPTPKEEPSNPVGFMEAWEGYGNLPRAAPAPNEGEDA
jgi:hypothetical protein